MTTAAFRSGSGEPEKPGDKAMQAFAAGLGTGLADGLVRQLTAVGATDGVSTSWALWSSLVVPAMVVALVAYVFASVTRRS